MTSMPGCSPPTYQKIHNLYCEMNMAKYERDHFQALADNRFDELEASYRRANQLSYNLDYQNLITNEMQKDIDYLEKGNRQLMMQIKQMMAVYPEEVKPDFMEWVRTGGPKGDWE